MQQSEQIFLNNHLYDLYQMMEQNYLQIKKFVQNILYYDRSLKITKNKFIFLWFQNHYKVKYHFHTIFVTMKII
jgi:hypothetical protein